MVQTDKLKKGDMVLTVRVFYDFQLYKHAGIFDGENVIHLCGDKTGFIDAIQSATVKISSIKEFTGEDMSNLETIPCPEHVDRDQVVERAMSWVGKKFRNTTWNLFTNNCEHFSRWCIFEEAESKQLETMPSVLMQFISHVTGSYIKMLLKQVTYTDNVVLLESI